MTYSPTISEYCFQCDMAEEKAKRLVEYFANRGDANPERLTWANVGDVKHANELLDELLQFVGLQQEVS